MERTGTGCPVPVVALLLSRFFSQAFAFTHGILAVDEDFVGVVDDAVEDGFGQRTALNPLFNYDKKTSCLS